MDMDQFTEDQHAASAFGLHLYEENGTRYFSDRFVDGRRFNFRCHGIHGPVTFTQYQGSSEEWAKVVEGLAVSQYWPPGPLVSNPLPLTASYRVWSWSPGALGEV